MFPKFFSVKFHVSFISKDIENRYAFVVKIFKDLNFIYEEKKRKAKKQFDFSRQIKIC